MGHSSLQRLFTEVLTVEDTFSGEFPWAGPKPRQAYSRFAREVKARLATSLEPWIHVLSEVLLTYVSPLVPLVLATATSGTWFCNCLILLVTECHFVHEQFIVNLLI